MRHLLKYADHDAAITGLDISPEMLRRARGRLKSNRPRLLSADLSRLPFADGAFDCVTCGYVLEHLPDARPGLTEMARVLARGGRMLLLTTEDSFGGAWTSRLFLCRTYNRHELLQHLPRRRFGAGARIVAFRRAPRTARRRHLPGTATRVNCGGSEAGSYPRNFLPR